VNNEQKYFHAVMRFQSSFKLITNDENNVVRTPNDISPSTIHFYTSL